MNANPCLLVVDDEPAVLRLLEAALRAGGWEVLKAGSGRQAVELYGREQGRVSLVLCDVRMDGMDGPATLAALRGLNPHVRCCFMSGHTGGYSAEQLLQMGASCVLPKPFGSLAQLCEALSSVLGRSA